MATTSSAATGEEEEADGVSGGGVLVEHTDSTYSCQIDNVQILCSFDRNSLKSRITCTRNDGGVNDDDDDAAALPKKILVQWTDLMLKHFEEIHGLSRILLLLPDKCATAIAINNEDLPPPDSGAFLIELVKNLLQFYSSDRFRQKQAKEFNEAIQELIQSVDQIIALLNDRKSPVLILETTKLLLTKCDVLYLAVLFYMDFIHPQLLAIQRNSLISGQELFEIAQFSILRKYKTTPLSHEFDKLFTDENC